MRILFVTHWFYPRSTPRALRVWELYNNLKDRGYKIDLLIGDFKLFIKDEDFNRSFFDEMKLNYSKNKKYSNSKIVNLLKKSINYFFGDRYLLSTSKFIFNNIDSNSYQSIVSFGFPYYVNFITALKFRKPKKYRPVLICEWSDPFYGSKDVHIAPYFKFVQIFISKTFDYTVIPTSNALEYYLKYVEEDKLKVIPQGIDYSLFQISSYKQNDVPTFGYAGIFYEDIRNPESFLQFLSTIDRDFIFVLYTVTHGNMYDKILIKYKNILGKKLEINNLIPRKDVIYQLSTFDFLINFENTNILQVPSKLIDYAVTQRPILSFNQNNIPKDTFISFLDKNYVDCLNVNIEEYDINSVSDKFIKLMNIKGEK